VDGNHWTQKHIKWLQSLEFEETLLEDVFDSYFTEMQHCIQRLASLDTQVEKLAETDPYKEMVGLLRCFHGIDTLSAVTTITEIFDFGRFSSPGELMSYLGLTCSEFSSGERQKRGPITRAGNKRVRRILVEAAWHYRHPCNVSKALKDRRNGQPQWAIDIADRAGQRLRKRYRHLTNCGKMSCKVTVAIARELAGFIWSVFKEYRARKSVKQAA
jgi:transposase